MRPPLSPPCSPAPAALRPSLAELCPHTHQRVPVLVELVFPLGTVHGEWRELLSSSARLWGSPAPCPGPHPLCLQIDQPTLGMPSREYYFNEGSNQKVSQAGPQAPPPGTSCLPLCPARPPVTSGPTCDPASPCDPLTLAAHS